MRLRIRTVGDAKVPVGMNLRVENAETGQLLTGVASVRIACDGRKSAVRAILELVDVEVDVHVSETEVDTITVNRIEVQSDDPDRFVRGLEAIADRTIKGQP